MKESKSIIINTGRFLNTVLFIIVARVGGIHFQIPPTTHKLEDAALLSSTQDQFAGNTCSLLVLLQNVMSLLILRSFVMQLQLQWKF